MIKKNDKFKKVFAIIIAAATIMTSVPCYSVNAEVVSDSFQNITESSSDTLLDSSENKSDTSDISDAPDTILDSSVSSDEDITVDDKNLSDSPENISEFKDEESFEDNDISIESISRKNECGDNLEWDFNNGTLTISGTGEMYDFDGTRAVPWEYIESNNNRIKKVIVNSGVTHIGSHAFNESQITSITLPSTLVSIGDYAFYDTSITSITIPGKVSSIGEGAFFSCDGLKSISIPSSVNSIGDSAFMNCYSLSSVTFASGLKHIGNRAFEKCTSLEKVILPSTLEYLGNSSFNSCSKLTSLTVSGIKSIGTSAFNECTSLTSVTMNEGTEVIEASAFFGNSSLTTVKFPNSLKIIGDSAFQECSSLTSVSIPNNVTDIELNAFRDCPQINSLSLGKSLINIGYGAFRTEENSLLTNVVIPDSVMFISADAFPYYTHMQVSKTFEYEKSNSVYEAYDFSTTQKTTPNLYATNVNHKIGDNITYFYSADYDNPGYYSLMIGGSGRMYDNPRFDEKYRSKTSNVVFQAGTTISNIGNNAFANMNRLKDISFPSSITEIGSNAFYNCTNLSTVNLNPASVKSIGDHAFDGCSKLSAAYLGTSVESIGDYAFYNCPISNISSFPSSLKTIGESAFSNTYISSLTSLGSVKTISNSAFNGCSKLASVNISGYVEEIGDYAFSNCYNLTSLSIGSSVKSMGDYAFAFCSKLTSVSIPSSVKTIGICAFSYCSGLTNVYLNSGLESLGEEVFDSCSSLTSISLPKSVTYLGRSAFNYCSNLSSVSLGSIKVLDSFFYGCSTLKGKTLTIPDSVEKIIGGCFSDDLYINLSFNPDYKWYTASNKEVALSFYALSSDNYESTNLYRGDIYTHYADGTKPVKPVVYTYSIAFNSNSGAGTMAKLSNITAGNNINLPKNTFTKKGYDFAGWASSLANANSGIVDYADEAVFSYSPSRTGETINLYAVWKGANYSVSFDVNAEDVSKITYTLSKQYNEEIGMLPTPNSRTNYHFNGWFDSETKELVNENTIITKNTLLIASWKKISDPLNAPVICVNGKPIPGNYYQLFGSSTISLWAPEDVNLTYTLTKTTLGATTNICVLKEYSGPFEIKAEDYSSYRLVAYAKKTIDDKNILESNTFCTFGFYRDSEYKVLDRSFDVELYEPALGYTGTWKAGNTTNPGVSVTYSGSAITFDSITIKKDDEILKLNKDYRITYANNTKVANYNAVDKYGKSIAPRVTITGAGVYSGKVDLYFSILPADGLINISKNYTLQFSDTGTATAPKLHYNGQKHEPKIYLKPKNNSVPELTENVEYEVNYYNNLNAGKATLKVVGKGSYNGIIKKDFTIAPFDFAKDSDLNLTTSNISISPFKYNKNGVTPSINLEVANSSHTFEDQLIIGKDYKVTYKNNKAANIDTDKYASAEITGIGNYKGVYKNPNLQYKISYGELSPNLSKYYETYLRYVPNKAGIYDFKFKVYDNNSNIGKPDVTSTDYLVSYYYDNDTDVINNRLPVHRTKGDLVDKKDIIPANTRIVVEIDGKKNYLNSTTRTSDDKIIIVYTNTYDMSVSSYNVAWDNKAGICKPKLEITDENTNAILKAGTDYDKNIIYTYCDDTYVTRTINRVLQQIHVSEGDVVNSKDIVPIGTEIEAKIVGIKNYAGQVRTTRFKYLIDLSKAKITIKPQKYDLYDIFPNAEDITISIGTGKNIIYLNNNDYILEYPAYDNNGKSSQITFTGRGRCFNNKTVKYNLLPNTL